MAHAPSDPDEGARRRRRRLLLWSLVAVAAVLRLAPLDLDGYWLDETATAKVSVAGYAEMVEMRARLGHPPLFFSLTWLIAHLAGTGEAGLRLPAALAGIACVPLLYLLVVRVAGARAALLAAGFLAVSPTHLDLSLMARPYTLTMLFCLAATLMLVGEDRPEAASGRRLGGFALLELASLATHYSSLLVIATHAAWALRRRRWRYAAAAAAVGSLYVPWSTWAMSRRQRSHGPLATLSEFGDGSLSGLAADLVVHLDGWGWLDERLGPPTAAALGWIVVVLFLGLAAAGAMRTRGEARLLVWLWLVPPVLAMAAVAAGGPNLLQEVRWFLVTGAAFLALVALRIDAIAAATRAGSWRRRAAAGAAVAVLAGGCALELAQPKGTDWRGVARVLEAERRPDEALLVWPEARVYVLVLRYYYDGPLRLLDEMPQPQAMRQGVWVAWSPDAFEAMGRRHPFVNTRARGHLRELRKRFPVERHYPLRSGTLIHLGPPTQEPRAAP